MAIDFKKLRVEQDKLSKRISTVDDIPDDIRIIAGGSPVFTEDKIIYAMVACDFETMEIKEKKYSVLECRFPHLPEFLSYREAPAAVETYHKLEIDPDVILLKGNGILHPRKMGVASHIGLLIDKPTIGVSKHLICGEEKGNVIYLGDYLLGQKLETKEHAKPVYISAGHRISLKTSIGIINNALGEHKLPEPVHQAHKYANKIKKRFKEENIEEESTK